MRILIVSVAIALMMVFAHAQDTYAQDMGKTRKHQNTQNSENTAKTKADEQAYKEALKRIPNSTKKADPWQNVR
jgi:hypothetical protein